MDVPLGEVLDLMAGVVDAGVKGPRPLTAPSMFDAPPSMRTAAAADSTNARRLRRAAVLLLLAGLWSDVDRHEGLPATGDHPINRPGNAMAQNAAPDRVAVAMQIAAPPQRDTPAAIPSLPPRQKRSLRRVVPETQVASPPASELGMLDAEIVKRYVERATGRVRHCYEQGLQLQQTLQGVLKTHFQIRPDGSVAWATAWGVDREVAACVIAALETVQFPVSGGATDWRYDFDLVALPHPVPAIPWELH